MGGGSDTGLFKATYEQVCTSEGQTIQLPEPLTAFDSVDIYLSYVDSWDRRYARMDRKSYWFIGAGVDNMQMGIAATDTLVSTWNSSFRELTLTFSDDYKTITTTPHVGGYSNVFLVVGRFRK